VSNPPKRPSTIPDWLWMTIIVAVGGVALALGATWLLFLGLNLVTDKQEGLRQYSAGETVTKKIIATATQIVKNEL
ncbi:hypothetical protein KCU97_g17423, partial [Aureobasidium melanogenum]